MRSPIHKLVGTLLAVAVAVYLAANAYLFVFQRDYVFEPGGALAAPAEKGLDGVEVVTIRTGDGTELTGWFAPALPGRPTLLYFHGNAGNMSGRVGSLQAGASIPASASSR